MKAHRANRFSNALASALMGWVFVWATIAAESDNAIKLRIIDTVTHAPIMGASVYVRMPGDGGLRKVGESSNGVAEFSPINDDRMIEFRVEANGYQDRTELVTLEKGTTPEIDLYPAETKLQGVVVGAGGQLASGAKIAFAKGDGPVVLAANVRVRGGFVDPWYLTSATVTANADGSFSTTSPPGTGTMVVVHELGCGSAPLMGWTNGATIHLRPWASLRGRMLVNGIPAANRPIAAVICNLFNSNVRFYLLGFETTPDAEGKFVFERLPPGVVDLVQKVAGPEGRTMYSHWSSFVADATLPQDEVVYSLAGRDLTGFLTDHRGDAVNWRDMNIFASLVSMSRGPVDEFTPMAGPPGRPAPMFVSTVTANGEFSASAIPPGEYVLTVSCSEASKPTRRFVTKIVAPPGHGPFALGGIVVTNIAK